MPVKFKRNAKVILYMAIRQFTKMFPLFGLCEISFDWKIIPVMPTCYFIGHFRFPAGILLYFYSYGHNNHPHFCFGVCGDRF